jgi:hypothetical protein
MGKQFIFAKGTASFKMGLVTAGVIRSQNRALWHLSSLAESGRDRATEESAYVSSNFCMQRLREIIWLGPSGESNSNRAEDQDH